MLYVMRHGRTDWNAKHKLQGRSDIPINDDGREMALNAYEEYKSVNIDVCYCSPLIRAVETAEIVLKGRNIPIIKDDRLKEMSFGDYEGTEYVLEKPNCPIAVIFKDPEKYVESIGGAETFDELFARTGEFLKEVVEPQLKEGKDILIVGHGAMNSSIICQRKGMSIGEFWDNSLRHCTLFEV